MPSSSHIPEGRRYNVPKNKDLNYDENKARNTRFWNGVYGFEQEEDQERNEAFQESSEPNFESEDEMFASMERSIKDFESSCAETFSRWEAKRKEGKFSRRLRQARSRMVVIDTTTVDGKPWMKDGVIDVELLKQHHKRQRQAKHVNSTRKRQKCT